MIMMDMMDMMMDMTGYIEIYTLKLILLILLYMCLMLACCFYSSTDLSSFFYRPVLYLRTQEER